MPKKPSTTAKKGFTLIELVMAITILAILSIIGFSSYSSFQKKARDLKRKADMQELQVALKLYKQDHGQYPPSMTPAFNNWNNIPTSAHGNWNITLGTNVLTGRYIAHLPLDPLNSCGESFAAPGGHGCYSYDYWSALPTAFAAPCPQTHYQVFVLMTRLENKNDPDSIGHGTNRYYCNGATDIKHIRGVGQDLPDEEYILVGM